MEKKTWLAIILSSLVWFGYMSFLPKPPEKNKPTTVENKAEGQTDKKIEANSEQLLVEKSKYDTVSKNKSSVKKVLENSVYKIDINLSEAKIIQAELKQAFSQKNKTATQKILLFDEEKDAINQSDYLFNKNENLLTSSYELQQATDKSLTLVETSGGFEIKKKFTIQENSYYSEVTLEIKSLTNQEETLFYEVVLGSKNKDYNYENPLKAWEFAYYQNEGLVRKKWDATIQDQEIVKGNNAWISFGNKYFTQVIINQVELNPDIKWINLNGTKALTYRYPLHFGKTPIQRIAYKIYLGPKEESQLAFTSGLKGLIDYGMFSFVAFPLLTLLKLFYHFLNNYGLAIIALTLFVRVIFLPLTIKSSKSMKAMQKLQPQIQALKEKYKDDSQTFAAEQMKLFKTNKVNPIGGCLPMLIQLPVFIALYAVLGNSIELHQAPFVGWIQDLSSKDPFYILPVLMGITMFIQQKMTPVVGMDPAQQKILLIMPVFFSFIMINLPSGLTLYIFLSTLLGIMQQYYMNKHIT